MSIELSTGNILAIDAGNTRIKWGLFNATGLMLEQGDCFNADLATAVLPDTARVVISNVAGNAVEEQLKSLLAKSTATIHWIRAQANACGVNNGYDQPATLGTDRWAALVAAWHIKQAPCVVVNAGTAVTIDALSMQPHNSQTGKNNQAEFIGGLILPGLNLMQQSLGHATAQLPKLSPNHNPTLQPHVAIFAKNTADAIHAGALHAILGAITLMARELNAQCKQAPYIVISGGNAPIIYQQAIKGHLMADVTKQALIVDNLVLQGLYLLENFMQSEQQ